jgi:hypothetical protein
VRIKGVSSAAAAREPEQVGFDRLARRHLHHALEDTSLAVDEQEAAVAGRLGRRPVSAIVSARNPANVPTTSA